MFREIQLHRCLRKVKIIIFPLIFAKSKTHISFHASKIPKIYAEHILLRLTGKNGRNSREILKRTAIKPRAIWILKAIN